MNIILLSGGSGKRLWPLSNDIRSKQFIKLFKDDEGHYESMVQRVYHQIMKIDSNANIVIATSITQVGALRNQLCDDVKICTEPARRDTFPAICLAASFLHDVCRIGKDETAVVLPVDPYVDYDYFKAVDELYRTHLDGSANLSVMGVEPTYPSEKYGYIVPETNEHVSKVEQFTEKPDREKAEGLIRRHALWNCGIFALKLNYLLDICKTELGTDKYSDLYDNYPTLKKISFDYAVAEKEKNIQVLRFSGEWKDVGTWNTFSEVMAEPTIGKVSLNDRCENCSVVNELDIPVLVMGMKNCIIAAGNDGILISEKEESSYIKPYVEAFTDDARYIEKSWGSFTVLSTSKNTLTIRIELTPGHALSYHYHEHRNEVWTVADGKGEVTINGETREVNPGDTIAIPIGTKHTLKAITSLQVIEVQMGDDISINDKIAVEG